MSPRPTRGVPVDFCTDWPAVPSNDRVAEVARQFVVNLNDAIDGRSIREIARVTEVDRATIGAVLAGKSWPDIVTLVRLERGLGSLWPGVGPRS